MKGKAKFKNIINYYRNSSIQHIISISFTMVAVIGMVIVSLALYIRFTGVSEEMASNNSENVLQQVNLSLDRYLRDMMKISDSMYYRVIKKADLSRDDIKKEMDLLYETNKDSLISISVFSHKGEVVASYPLTQLKDTVDPRDTSWFASAVNKRENLHFSTPHVQNLFIDPNYRYRWVVSLSRSVELTKDGEIDYGVLLVDMNFSGIDQIFKNITVGNNGYVYLIDREGEIIYHPRQQLIYSNLVSENNVKAATFEDGTTQEVFKGVKRLVTVKTVGYTGWKVVAVTPVSDLTTDTYEMKIFFIFILIFAIFLLSFVNMYVSSKIANPIKNLENSVKELEVGMENITIPISGSNELQHLGTAIEAMVNQMQDLMKNIVKEQEAKRKSELNALQAQINPHFLYNTLDSIIWMIENNKYEAAIIMVTSLARLFRISISKGKNTITLKDEIDHVKNYLTIQSMRYKNKFIYEIEAEEEVLNLATIKLIIQPLVENAIYHSMEFMDDDGEIFIKAYKQQGELYIDVSDNGMGMPEEKAEELLKEDYEGKSKGSGIGLKNVNDRIKLYFGEKYGITIFSVLDEGTLIRIYMPAIEYDLLDEEGELMSEKKS